MAGNLVPDIVWEQIEPLLPARPVSPKGGRPAIGDREVLTGIIFVLKTGIPWEELPLELGCGCGMTCLRRLRGWQQSGVWSDVQLILREQLPSAHRMDWRRVKCSDSDSRVGTEEAAMVATSQDDDDLVEMKRCSCRQVAPLPSPAAFREGQSNASDDRVRHSRCEGMKHDDQ